MPRREPKPISMKKPRHKKAAVVVPDTTIEPFNMDAPEHRDKPALIIQKTVKDKALERRVTVLEGASDKEVVVKLEMPLRPRISMISIKYDEFGNPKTLVPSYGE